MGIVAKYFQSAMQLCLLKIIKFTLSCEVNGMTEEATSYSSDFTKEQIDIIRKMKVNSKVHIHFIMVKKS